MPRCCDDHRRTEGRRISAVFAELMEGLPGAPRLARRVALLAAQAFVSYQDVTLQIGRARRNKRSAVEIRRLEKQRRLSAGNFLQGLRELQAMVDRDGNRPPDLARKIQAAQQRSLEDGNGR
jgi:hypothetical protein